MASAAIIKYPSAVSLSGNPVNFKIAGKNAYSGPAYKYNAVLNRNGTFNDADAIVLTWYNNLKQVIITARTVVVYDNDLPLGANNNDICDKLNSNAIFAEDFQVYINDSGTISILARNAGTQYNITKTGFLAIDLSLMLNGSDATLTSFYKIIAAIEKDGEIIIKHALPVAPDTTEDNYPGDWDPDLIGYAEIDIADSLKEEIRGHFTLVWEQDEFVKVHNILKTFRLYAYAQSAIPPVNGAGVYSGVLRCLQGKLENFRQGELNYLEKTFYDLLQESQMFLTFAPTTKKIDIYQPEILYFLFTTQATYRLWVEETYTDGTTASSARDQFSAAAFSIYEFNIGYKGIRSNLDKTLVSYKVWITTNTDVRISEERTFIIDYNYYNNARYFFFRNSLGVYECIRFTGKAIKNRDIQKDFVSIPLPKNFIHTDRAEKQLNADAELVYDINTGFLADEYWADYLQEFLESFDVYWLKKGTAYPVSIKESKNTISEDGEYNPSANFQLTHSIHDDFTENFTANEPISVGDFNLDFNTDYFIGGSTIYFNVEQSQSFTRNNCGQNYNGSLVWYTIAAGTYSSRISQADADNKALAYIALHGQEYANTHGSCIFNGSYEEVELAIVSQSDTSEYITNDGAVTVQASKGIGPYFYEWEDGPTTPVRTGLAAGEYICMVTDSIGHTAAVNVTIARTNLWYNIEMSQVFAKNDCPAGQDGTDETYTVPARTYSSTTSQAHANSLAQDDINANGQDYANTNGSCTVVSDGILAVSKDVDVVTFGIHIDYMNGITDDITTTGNHTVKQRNALITLSDDASYGLFNGTIDIFIDTPTLVTFGANNTLVLQY